MVLTGRGKLELKDLRVKPQWRLYLNYAEDPAFLADRIRLELIWLSGVDSTDTWTILKSFQARGIVRLSKDVLELDI